jgi:HD-GYP domain-containing protein (c-di-GMP phosphodiesterase class II)
VSDADKPTFRPADERCRDQGLLLIVRFHALLRVGRSYRVGNQVFHKQCTSFLDVLAPVFEDAPEAILVSLDSDLYLNGVRIPVKANNLRFHQSLLEEFRRRRIAGLRFESGLSVVDLEKFFALFLQPDAYFGPGLLEACISDGVLRILPAVHASTQAPGADDPFDPRAYENWSPGDAESGAGASGDGSGGSIAATGPTGPAVGGVRPVAEKYFSLALHGARSLLTTTALQDGIELRHAKRVVQPLIDGAFSNEPVVVGLSTLSHHDEYTYAHSVNVCVVAVTMGHMLELDRRALADLGVAALLHDVGKAAVYDQIQHPLEEFTPDERAAAERHPLEGARLIARSTALNQTTVRCMRAALEHHAVQHTGGYPDLVGTWTPSRLSEIVAVADCYVSLQMHRSERGRAVTPYDALGMLLGPLASQFDPALLWALVRTVGFYPPGQMVELSDDSVAVVLAPNPDDLHHPHVRVVMDPCGVPFAPVEAKDLRPLPPTLQVKRALKAEEYPVLPGDRVA